ncbi:post-initiation translation factor DPC29 PWA37_005390 [Arxiozyma heterogenica]|uniref:post-initiation translation factor DPC29 n=1 Tax=Arxiozyma heterogenica TaxID=278026 RepID=UPI002F177F67
MLVIRKNSYQRLINVRYFTTNFMKFSGHSKWSTIKHDKMKNDSLKNKISNRFSNQITTAVKLKDPQLAALIEKAMKSNVSKKVIENAIKKGQGISINGGNSTMSINLYEGVGPEGCSIIIETLTDNKNRTVSLVRGHFNKFGYNMTGNGSCLHYFNKVGIIKISKDACEQDEVVTQSLDEEEVWEKVIDIDGIIDIKRNFCNDKSTVKGTEEEKEEEEEGWLFIITEPSDTSKIALKVKDLGYSIEHTGIEYMANEETRIQIKGKDKRESYKKFIEGLQGLDDVVKVYTNAQL